MIRLADIESPAGKLTAAKSEAGLCYLALPGLEHNLKKHLARFYPDEEVVHDQEYCEDVKTQLAEYFAGERTGFDLQIDLQTTGFFRKALNQVSAIPYGQTKTYRQLASELGNPDLVRAVGGANARNPLPIIIPCHRVLASDGTLTGYAGGLKMKADLLQLEGVILGETISLF